VVLIYLWSESIQEALDEGSYGCGIFIDLQKAFDTVDKEILLSKLDHYGIRGVANNLFRFYLTDRKQFVNVNGFHSDLQNINIGVPQGSVLGPLLSLIYINDLNNVIKYCKVHHFADDTNLLCINKSFTRLNKHINIDLKNLSSWLIANKISLNVQKTELVIFKPKKRPCLEFDLKIKLNRERLIPSSSIKYLGVIIDENLNWDNHINNLSIKLNRANAMLSKVRYYVNNKTLLSIYHAIFQSHLIYACKVWGQSFSKLKRLIILQKKAVRLINFAPKNSHTNPLFHQSKMLKINDFIKVENCLFISKSMNKLLPEIFLNWFHLVIDTHNHVTRNAIHGHLNLPSYRTNIYGRHSFIISSINSWNYFQRSFPDKPLWEYKIGNLKNLLSKMLIDSYKNID